MTLEPREDTRPRLSRDRVLAAAVALADESGIEALSMRKIGERLGVEAMSLYRHVANKDDLLDGMVDGVFAEIDLGPGEPDWRAAVRSRAVSLREVLRRHPWAVPLMQSRANPGPSTLGHLDALIGGLRGAGFSVELTAHALSAVDSYVYGFALQEAALPFDSEQRSPAAMQQMLDGMLESEWPHLVQFAREHVLQPGYDYSREFEWGLDLVLDGLEGARAAG